MSASLRYLHSKLHLRQLEGRGSGYVATGPLRRGELLLEEQPFIWDSGAQASNLQEGADWLVRSGLATELACDPRDPLELVQSYAFRTVSPCQDGAYPTMLFRAASRFNHSCFPNAGGHLPDGAEHAQVADFEGLFRVYALEEIREGEEVCISYLSTAQQLQILSERRRLLETWGFCCRCERCLGARPLDRRLEAGDRALLQDAARAYAELAAGAGAGGEAPEAELLTRLGDFRQRFALDAAHVWAQEVRGRLLALLLGLVKTETARERAAGPALELLVEEMQVQHALLPSLSPGKAESYAQFLKVLRYVPEKEAQWHVSNLKVDGCELQHQQALWLHDQKHAKEFSLKEPRNLPPRPLITAPMRTGPVARPGAACSYAASSLARRQTLHARRRAWPHRCREDEMPPLMEAVAASGPLSLWEAYAEFGQPSKDARRLRPKAKERAKDAQESWFKFRMSK